MHGLSINWLLSYLACDYKWLFTHTKLFTTYNDIIGSYEMKYSNVIDTILC